MADASVSDPPGPVPDPAIFPSSRRTSCSGAATKGEQQIKLFGDPSKPGMYGVLDQMESRQCQPPAFP